MSLITVKDLRKKYEDFEAVRGVSFEVKKGEILGIIGKNGAGKSTLLKILSRITPPTAGSVTISGRISSLLEVGTGFNPELTGRENIYLNGAILGMRQSQIRKKFDEILAFSGTEKFLDTPVKYYSSGMYMRLAFSVAAHLEADILLIDEVLAVGDIAFQKKCLGKMEDISKSGRTVLFVSHNLDAVERLCDTVVILESGRCGEKKEVQKGIEEYIRTVREDFKLPISMRKDRTGKGNIRFVKLDFFPNKYGRFTEGEDIQIQATLKSNYSKTMSARLALSVSTESQIGLISCDSLLIHQQYPINGKAETIVSCILRNPPLMPGNYQLHMSVFVNDQPEDWISPIGEFSIVASKMLDGEVASIKFNPIRVKFEWVINS